MSSLPNFGTGVLVDHLAFLSNASEKVLKKSFSVSLVTTLAFNFCGPSDFKLFVLGSGSGI